MIARNLFHVSSHDFKPEVGEDIFLVPGKQNAQGLGVYFSLNKPDIRASDSVHENGLSTIFDLTVVDSKKNWWTSKGCRDKKKNRPQTWHSKGHQVKVEISEIKVIDQITHIMGTGSLVH